LRFNKTPSQRRIKLYHLRGKSKCPDAISARICSQADALSGGTTRGLKKHSATPAGEPSEKKEQQGYERERLTRTGKGDDGRASALMGIRSTDAGIVNNLSLTKRWYVWPERESGVATRRALTPTRVEVELTACHSVCGSGCSLAGFYGGGGCRSGCAQPSAHDDARSLDHAARTAPKANLIFC
jgi:hypothetical protein